MSYEVIFLSVVCFIFGYCTHKLISFLFNYGLTGVMCRNVGIETLKFLGSTAESVAFIKTLKIKVMKESKIPDSVVETSQHLFEESFSMWKRTAIQNFLSGYPKAFKHQMDFDDWDGAMKFLTNQAKK